MEGFKAIKFLHVVEKILNIHRDYLYMSKTKRLFTTVMVALDLAVSILLCIDNVQLVTKFYSSQIAILYSVLFFHLYFVVLSNLLMLFFGPRFGKEFRKILINLSCMHQVVKFHLMYSRFHSNLKLKCMVIILSIFSIRVTIDVSLVMFAQLHISYKNQVSAFSHTMFFVLRTWSEVRFVTGILMYYCLLAMVENILQIINKLIENTHSGMIKDDIDSFALVYCHMHDSIGNLEKCFGHQVLLSLALSGSHFVFTVYKSLQDFLATGNIIITVEPSTWFNLVLHTGVFIVVAIQGQRVPNEVSKMKRNLAKILQISFTDLDPTYYQGLKDLYRLVSVQPLTIRLLQPLPVGMYLLPTVLSLTVNYIIVSLQLNHDI